MLINGCTSKIKLFSVHFLKTLISRKNILVTYYRLNQIACLKLIILSKVQLPEFIRRNFYLIVNRKGAAL